jgi:lipid A disaccharide synthetase
LKKIFIIAGEQSGEMHAAFLMDKIKDMIPDIQFFVLVGNKWSKED